MAKAEFPRKGAWAKLADGTVGIINSIQGGAAEFHTVDGTPKGEFKEAIGHYARKEENGPLILVDGVPLEFLSQAAHADIPKNRRPAKAHGEALGYK